MRKIIASVDLGSDTIKFLITEVIKDKIHVLSSYEEKSHGIKSGLIVNPNEVTEVLKKGFYYFEETLGVKISKVLVNIKEIACEFYIGEGVTNVNNEERIITGNEITKALQNSVSNYLPSNMELINLIPIEFIVDDEEITKTPKRLNATKLGVKSVIVASPKKQVIDVLKCFEGIGINITDIVFGALADYFALKNERTNSEVGALINIGHHTTTVSIFNKGIITNCEVLEIGGVSVDNDISFIYKTTMSDAKELKEEMALANKRLAETNNFKNVTNKLGENISVNQYELSEIAESRVQEILNLAKKQINLLTKKEISYIIITGGLTEMKDFSLIVEETFGKNVYIGEINTLGIRDNKYSQALGMIKYFDDKLQLRDKSYSIFNSEEEKALSEVDKRINVSTDSILGKIFGYFFDN